ncbi:MAG: DUF3179 domain-containing protein [Verrucomicrobiota bacterium]
MKRVSSVGMWVMALACLAVVGMGYEVLREAAAEQERGVIDGEVASERAAVLDFLGLLSREPEVAGVALARVRAGAARGDAALLAEVMPFVRSKAMREELFGVLEGLAGDGERRGLDEWRQWVWTQPYPPREDYAGFKALLYRLIDSRFEEYFDDDPAATIRLDEIRWGGVKRDGIPPLKDPTMVGVDAMEARYLDDDDVVFGVSFNGDARAYPKRILAWHEMVKDVVGGLSINGVYCTLCGSMIVYATETGGKHYELGTSGFLYRSNKLMYDHGTKSMWSTFEGKPVVGPLVGEGIELERLYVVTTTWGEWKRRHPETTVLTLDTGHRRDYGEGVAYREYFGTDELMFDVPDGLRDRRLKNKDEVLALVGEGDVRERVAIAVGFLKKEPVYHLELGGKELVVLTDESGAARVYETGGRRIVSWDGIGEAIDGKEGRWGVSEAGMTGADGEVLARYPAHRAFWFGWRAVYPETELVK